MPRNPINNESSRQFIFHLFECLNAPNADKTIVDTALRETGEHFGFGCGFVYEMDHSGVFHLCEHFRNYDSPLDEHFQIEDSIPRSKVSTFSENPFLIRILVNGVLPQEDADIAGARRIFASSTFIIAPVADAKGRLIALVGMADRRTHAHFNDDTLSAAKMALGLLVTRVRIRVLECRLDDAKNSLGAILDNLGIDIYVNDFETHEILYVNRSMAAPYGGIGSLLGRKCWKALYQDKIRQCDFCPQFKLLDENGKPTKVYSWDYRRPFDGSWFRVFSGAFRWLDGRLAHVVSSVDITENKRNEALIARMADYDQLTDLPNRRKLQKNCAQAINNDGSGYLVFIDFDNFKLINDREGHQAGDDFLCRIARILREYFPADNVAHRYGGDEFVLLLPRIDHAELKSSLRSLLKRFARPRIFNGRPYTCRASMGVARFPEDSQNATALLELSDQMMYRAKENGKGIICFSDGLILTENGDLSYED